MKPGTTKAVFTPPEQDSAADVLTTIAQMYRERSWKTWDIEPVDGRVLWTTGEDGLTLYWREEDDPETTPLYR